jgi:hypothetical protein
VSEPRVYRCSPSIVWVKDVGQTMIVDREEQRSWTLHDTEAAIWDLITVGYPYRKLVPMLSLLLSLPVEETTCTLTGVLEDWQEAGIVYLAQEVDDG